MQRNTSLCRFPTFTEMKNSKEKNRQYNRAAHLSRPLANTSQYRSPTPGLSEFTDVCMHGDLGRFSDKATKRVLESQTLRQYIERFDKEAVIAQNAFEGSYDNSLTLVDEEEACFQQEAASRWRLLRAQWLLALLCVMEAATLGWSESAVSGGKTS